MVLNGATNNMANVALKDQVDNAVAAGDKTSFEAAKATLLSMLSPTASNTPSVQQELINIENNTAWKANGGAQVIDAALENAGGAAGAGDWSSAGAGALQTFESAFSSKSDMATLKYDASQVEGTLSGHTGVDNDINAELTQALAYAAGGYTIGKNPSEYGVQSAWSNLSPATISPSVSTALSTLSAAGSNMALGQGAANGKAAQALTDQALGAINAGDQATFNSAYKAIEHTMNDVSSGSNGKVLNALATLSAETQWRPSTDVTQSSLAANLQRAADAMGGSDWQGNPTVSAFNTFMQDFKGGASYATLSSDAAKVCLNASPLSNNLTEMMYLAMKYVIAQNG